MGVIEDVPEDMELENMTQQLTSENQNKRPIPFQVIDGVRLKMRVKETHEETKEEKIGMERVGRSMFDV
jgi:hypothetical protein